jgi:hypothetical protein
MKLRHTIGRMTIAAAAALGMAGALTGCNSLHNPDRVPIGVRYASDGTLAVFFTDGMAIVDADLGIGHAVAYPELPPAARASAPALSADGRHALVGWSGLGPTALPNGTDSGGEKGTTVVFRTDDGTLEQRFTDNLSWGQDSRSVLSDGGQTLFRSGGDYTSPSTTAYRTSDGAPLWTNAAGLFHPRAVPGQDAVAGVSALYRATDAPAIVLRVLDGATGAARTELPLPFDEIGGLAVSPDGHSVVVSGGTGPLGEASVPGPYLLIDLAQPSVTGQVAFPDGLMVGGALALSSTAGTLAASHHRSITSNDYHPNANFVLFSGGSVRVRTGVDEEPSLAFSPDGTKLAFASLQGVKLLDASDGTVLVERSYQDDVF